MNRSPRQKLKLLAIAVIALATLLIGLSLLGTSRNRASADAANWSYASNSAPSGLVQQIAANHLSPDLPVDSGRMKVLNVQLPGQKQPLYLVDSRITNLAQYPHVNPLCGASGCAFFGYIPTDIPKEQQFQEVWNAYLNVNLPPNVSLFESSDALQNGLPVLKINQMQGNRVEQSHWSFNGQEYEVTKTLLTPQTYE
ncbi:MAG: hypothetical protein KME07_12940 [Pegethrix bostrychoides GSE-TBD4-15B]|jgi:hypothetical protein|uniref:Uncharacterized protein n=1 Tax=Pegethrix bostrychoides GSE-TBD4-15B TaxID=2839662 RepID=A0A951PB94_9CYAN|nr:hypothetical protein [Pegethrix bostrychoides GSE-TBD4-15B]